MRGVKKNIFMNLLNQYIIDSALPVNISYLWGFGSILGMCLVIQIITGVLLAMHYTPHIEIAFSSIEHIMRDVNNGWLIRYLHLNGASMFFIMVYIHIGRGLFYGSFIYPRVLLWNIGVVIFLIMIVTAFLGYVLPWGQMSFWGATVITNMLSAIPWIGISLVEFVWGGFSVSNATLNRFFALHFLLPFLLISLVVGHLIALHVNGSNNPLGISSNLDRVSIHPYFVVKDILGFIIFFLLFFYFVFYNPNYLGHSDNSILANPLVTPEHIVPEWYFLPYYAILRAIPNKLGGVILMIGSILILIIITIISKNNLVRSSLFRPIYNKVYWVFIGNFLILGWIGGSAVVSPYMEIGVISTVLYFFFFIISIFNINLETLIILKSLKKLYN